jgi:hypothetical protein
MIIFVTNLMNMSEKHRLQLASIGIIDELIIVAQGYLNDLDLCESLIWFYSCLLNRRFSINAELQADILYKAAQLHKRHQTNNTALEMVWCTVHFLEGKDHQKDRINTLVGLTLDEECWEIVLNSGHHERSLRPAARVVAVLLASNYYITKRFSIQTLNKLINQLQKFFPFEDATISGLAEHRATMLYLIQQMLSCWRSDEACFNVVVYQLPLLSKIIETTQNELEMKYALSVLNVVVNMKPSELKLGLSAHPELFRSLLTRLDSDQSLKREQTLELLETIACVLDMGVPGESTTESSETWDSEYDSQQHQQTNWVVQAFTKYSEIDFLEKLQSSDDRVLADKAIELVNSYF